MTEDSLNAHLLALADSLITEATSIGSIREGVVMTVGPTPYRRLDCDGRALAYVRARPKKRAVRIDVSGLWFTPKSCRLSVSGASGAASLLVSSEQDLSEAVRYLRETVERTRAAQERATTGES